MCYNWDCASFLSDVLRILQTGTERQISVDVMLLRVTQHLVICVELSCAVIMLSYLSVKFSLYVYFQMRHSYK
jgi:hypothetical protein